MAPVLTHPKLEDSMEQMTRAAWLYYERGLTQEAVAHRLGTSRSTVSRLLSQARISGIVKITVTRPLPEVAALESSLLERFFLSPAIVEPQHPDETPAAAAARACARYLSRRVRMLGVLGIGWGTTLRTAAQQVMEAPARGLSLVDVVGQPPGGGAAVGVSNALGRAWRVQPVHVPAPAFPRSPEMAAALRMDPVVREVLARAREADLIILSIGGMDRHATLVRQRVLTPAMMQQLRAARAVGDLLGHFFDESGAEVRIREKLEIVGLDLSDLRANGRVVAVAAGAPKLPAIRAAIEARLIQGLITDESTAQSLLGESRPG